MKNTFKVKPLHCPMRITPFIWRMAAAASILVPVLLPGCCVLARCAA